MDISLCHYSMHRTCEAEGWTLSQLADYVVSLGLEGVDFHTRLIPPGTTGSQIRKVVADAGLVLTGLSFSNNFNVADASERTGQIRQVQEWIRLAASAGAPVSRIFGGHLKDRRDPNAREEGKKIILDALSRVVRTAEDQGVVLALENHGGLPCTGEEQVEVIEAIGSEYLRATIDVGNYMQCGQEGHAGTQIAAGHAAYLHFKDFRKMADTSSPWGWTIEPCTVGEGDVDHGACLKALRRAGYVGHVAIEYEGPDDESTGVPASVAYTRRVIEGLEA